MHEYPKEDARRGGCKVSWLYYKDKGAAEKAAISARINAQRLADEGYDFGFQVPGFVSKAPVAEGPYAGLYSVCIP